MSSKKHRHPALPKDSAWRFPLDKEKKDRSLFLLQNEIQQKHIRRYPSFAENVQNQLRFQTWQHWLMQGSILLAAIVLVMLAESRITDNVSSIAACSVFLVFAGNICFSGVGHLFSYHMAELEKTLYLDLKQMVCIQMLEGGFVCLAAMSLLTGFLGTDSECGIPAYLLYLLVPFIWSDILYLCMLTHLRSIFSGLRQFAAAMFCAALALFPAFFKDAYTEKYIMIWGLLAAAGCFFLAVEIYQMFQKIERGDNVCLN